MKNLYEALVDYDQAGVYPFHMPGHKRHLDLNCDLYKIDITEIEGFDSLHHAQGLILQVRQKANELYGAEETFLLVNGSTGGILAAIGACAKGGTMLVARNTHKSVYNGLVMHHVKTEYMMPEVLKPWGIAGPVTSDQVREGLQRLREAGRSIDGVLITSPTYEGVVSDVAAIAKVCHEYGIPLIVDAAHGAHLGFSNKDEDIGKEAYFPPSAVGCGADIVIHSIHKTLPAMTQTALLHVQGKLVNYQKVRRLLASYQTSSPSYILMAGICKCISLLENNGERLFLRYEESLKKLRNALGQCKHIQLLQMQNLDPGRIVLFTPEKHISGPGLMKLLRDKYRLEMEMAGPNYVIAITSIMDTEDGYQRFVNAIQEIDRTLPKEGQIQGHSLFFAGIPERKMEPWKALYMAEDEKDRQEKTRCLVMEEAKGSVSCEFAYVYPPGIPVIIPGEILSDECCNALKEAVHMGLSVEGMEDISGQRIRVIREEINQ